MSVTNLASPADHRAHAATTAGHYSELSATAAAQSDWALAVSCQWASDMHRVLAGLWGKAAAATDPETTFFSIASQAAAGALSRPADGAVRGREYIEASRERWTEVMKGLNVPMVFTPIPHLTGAPVVDWQSARDERLQGWEPGEYVQARLEQAQGLDGATGVIVAVEAYLIDQALAVGDEALVTVAAGMALVSASIPHDATTGEAVESARSALGVVQAVRASEYLPAA